MRHVGSSGLPSDKSSLMSRRCGSGAHNANVGGNNFNSALYHGLIEEAFLVVCAGVTVHYGVQTVVNWRGFIASAPPGRTVTYNKSYLEKSYLNYRS